MNLFLALLSAVLLTLTFPRFSFYWLIPVAMTPLLLACDREPRPLRRFLLGWVAGAGCLAGVTDWIRFVISVHGGLGIAGGWAVFALFCMSKGLYFALFALLLRPLLRGNLAIPAVAALWVAVDLTFGSLGFVWVTLGNAGSDMGIPARLAPYAGVHGLSFVFMMMSTSVALVFLRRSRRHLLWLLTLPMLILLPSLPEAQAGSATAVVLQPNIDESASWTPESVDRLENRLRMLSLRAALEGGDLLVWPEVPAPLYYDRDEVFRQRADDLARASKIPFLFGTVAHTPDGAPLNSAQLLQANGEPASRYDKIHLVPFGEFVPWPFGFANKITGEVGDFQPGTKVVISPIDGHKIGSFICYESAFSGLVRQFARDGAEVLFNLSNDGYFGKSESARQQHLLVVRMRAAENARWIVRVTNDGISAAVDPAGRVTQEVPSFVETTARLKYSYSSSRTFYTRHGDWFGWLSVAFSVIVLLNSRWRRPPLRATDLY